MKRRTQKRTGDLAKEMQARPLMGEARNGRILLFPPFNVLHSDILKSRYSRNNLFDYRMDKMLIEFAEAYPKLVSKHVYLDDGTFVVEVRMLRGVLEAKRAWVTHLIHVNLDDYRKELRAA